MNIKQIALFVLGLAMTGSVNAADITVDNTTSQKGIQVQVYCHDSGNYYPRTAIIVNPGITSKIAGVDTKDMGKTFSVLAKYKTKSGNWASFFTGTGKIVSGNPLKVNTENDSVTCGSEKFGGGDMAASKVRGFNSGDFKNK